MWNKCENPFLKKYQVVKIHGKDEHYTKFAEVRGIYARHDVFKVLTGPVFAAIGKKMFKLQYFFKNIKHDQRIEYFLSRMMRPGIGWETDHTSYEASFLYMQFQIEFAFYKFCVSNFPEAMNIILHAESCIVGKNSCTNKFFCFVMWFRRQSGEMNTSLGNSYYNLVLGAFVAYLSGTSIQEYLDTVLVEGDDGAGVTPIVPDAKYYERLGHIVKLEHHDNPCHASFCGMVFDEDSKCVVVSPIEKILEFGWSKHQYFFARDSKHHELIKAKALSVLYSYGACPMIAEVGRKFLELTNSSDAHQVLKNSSLNSYERQKWTDIIDHEVCFQEIDMKTRILVEQKYLIPIEVQLRFEQYIRNFTEVQPIVFPELLNYCKPEYLKYYDIYSIDVDTNVRSIRELANKFL